jgi:hypothetical protein
MSYTPHDWYWNNGTDVFSSRRSIRVPYADAEYQAWLALGGVATRDPGPAELREVLAHYGRGLTPGETAKLQKLQRFVGKPHLLAKVNARSLTLQEDLLDLVMGLIQTLPPTPDVTQLRVKAEALRARVADIRGTDEESEIE